MGRGGSLAGVILLLVIWLSGFSHDDARPISGLIANDDPPGTGLCTIRLTGGVWKGSCGQISGETPAVTVAPSKAITTGVWRAGIKPTAVWSGKMTYSDFTDEIEVEVYDRGSGVLRTTYGWFPVSNFVLSTNTLQFQFDSSHEIPPSELDRKIVQRAAAILSSDAVWNRADNRECATGDTKWSIYCAMEQATREITGGFHHRRPALQVVRQIVDARSAGRDYHHRLMDYNNDPSTSLQDVQVLFTEALARMTH